MSTTDDVRQAPLADAPVDPKSIEARAARFDPFARYPDGHERAGETVERPATCPTCSRAFTQYQLAPLLHDVAERRGARAVAALESVTPDGFVPVLCPPCESRALGEERALRAAAAPCSAQQALEL